MHVLVRYNAGIDRLVRMSTAAARVVPRPLGATRNGRRGLVCRVDAGRAVAARRLPG